VKVGDLVRTPNGVRGERWWWQDKLGILVKEALRSDRRSWHVMIGTQTANLLEEHLELLNESR
jgi:hypothetical protein